MDPEVQGERRFLILPLGACRWMQLSGVSRAQEEDAPEDRGVLLQE